MDTPLLNDTYVSFIFVLVGFLLLFLEVFIPSGGILGILSVACVGFGAYGLYHQEHGVYAMLSIAGFGVFGGVMLYFIIKRVSFKGAMTPDTSTSVDTRIVRDFIGKAGVTVTTLRPAGMAVIDGRKVDVVSIGDFIEKDVPVKVVDISGNRVVVRKLEEEGSR